MQLKLLVKKSNYWSLCAVEYYCYEMIKIRNPEDYIAEKITMKEYSKLSYIRKMKLEAYGYLVEAVKIIENEVKINY